jgi:CrcB protein
MPLQTLCVFVGAGGGALVRWRIGDWTRHLFPSFPPGTTIVNLAGCLLIGLAVGWFASRHDSPPELRLLVVTGFLGGFTTFSAFSLETLALWSERPVAAFLYAIGTVVACLLLTFIGMMVMRKGF